MKIQRLLAPLVGAILLGLSVPPASAQCNGTPSANTVCAGPASGGAGQFRARAIVPADLPIGTAVQAWDADLDAIAGLTTAANKLQYWTGSHTAALIDFPSWARSVVSAASASAGRTAFGLAIGTDVQAYDAELAAIAGLTSANNKCFYWTGSGTAATYDCSSFGRGLVNAADASAARTAIGAVIGTDVQAFDSDLSAVAALSSNGLIARTGTGAVATRTVTAPAAGITVSNGDGVSGNPTLALANDLAALEGLSTTGLIARTATDTAATRSIAAGTGMSVSNGDGVSGNPTVSLANTSVAAGSYTSADITVDAQGRITSASNGAGGGGGVSDTFRRNALLDSAYLSKALAQPRRVINSWATGFKGANDTANGINTGASSSYSVDATNGRLLPVLTDTWSTEVSTSLVENSAGWSGFTIRIILPPGIAANGDRLRLTLTPPTSGANTVISDIFVGHPGSGSAFDGTQVRVQFTGSSGVTLTAGGSNVVSDAATYAYDSTKSLMVAIRFTSGDLRRNTGLSSGYQFYAKSGSSASDASSTAPSGFGTATSGRSDVVSLVEARTIAGGVGYNVTTVAQTTDTSVSNARVLLEFDNTATPTLNTDITVEVTCNGGTNWASTTLSAVTANSQGGRSVAETADTACTAGTSAAARLKSFNSKIIPTHTLNLTVH